MVAGSPAKKRKKNPPSSSSSSPYKGKTLDHFFGKKPSPLPQPAASQEADGPTLTDEQFARKLAREWGEENQTVAENNGLIFHAGPKRPRSSSRERRDVGSSMQIAAERPEKEEDGEQAASAEAPLPGSQGKTVGSLVLSEGIGSENTDIPLDSDPLTFNPDDYQHLITEWPNGRATYGLLTRAFVLVNATKSRIKIVDTLVNILRLLIRLDPESLLPAVWLTTNDIGPPYENNELGVGSSTISKAIIKTSGITPATLKKLYHKYGDPGDVAFSAKSSQRTLAMRRPTPLTIVGVYSTLIKIAGTSGKGSQDIKETYVKRLLVDARGEEIRYLVRTLIQHLRIGAVKTTMLIALARAFTLRNSEVPKEKEKRLEVFYRAEETLKQCFARRPNYGDIVHALLAGRVEALPAVCGMVLHIPLKPMLGSITRDLGEMLVKLQGREFACEYKYDGQRAQIHCDENGRVEIFSRRLELMTDKYPDLVALVPQVRGKGITSFILEGEVVAVDVNTGELKPFQMLAGRERRNVEIENISVTVCLFAFDLMYMNGQELLSKPFRERRELLRTEFTQIPRKFTFVESLDAISTDPDTVRAFFTSALSSRCEGIMVKVLDNLPIPAHPVDSETPRNRGGRRKPLLATYEPDKRLESWLKVKRDYTSSGDTLDLIPIGAWHGQGRKAQWWSPILLAVRNPTTGELEAVCKCMSGFTDKVYGEITAFYAPGSGNTSSAKKGYYNSALTPAIWFEPREVWEIAFADVTLSPTYTAARGLVPMERGLSLRFPRFVRKRTDKSIDEASTGEFLADLYWKQERHGGGIHGNANAIREIEEQVVEEEEEEEEEDVAREDSSEPGELEGGGVPRGEDALPEER